MTMATTARVVEDRHGYLTCRRGCRQVILRYPSEIVSQSSPFPCTDHSLRRWENLAALLGYVDDGDGKTISRLFGSGESQIRPKLSDGKKAASLSKPAAWGRGRCNAFFWSFGTRRTCF
mmetsp:Transcript_12847/g.28981  ORF Transcript_12847/g.28981 Transcript_12847/m.28981 type:complete len:119 (-) Transcript_12847:1058-1414(-)